MFNWLVGKMNLTIQPDELKSGDPIEADNFERNSKTIGLLDIFGFECFDDKQGNHFE
jgi:myosin heavy subunit